MGANLPPRSGHGIVRVAHNYRVHVTNPRYWADTPGTDFWLVCGSGEHTAANAAGLDTLNGHGWGIIDIIEDAGSDGDFLSSSVDDPSNFHFDTALDLLTSPTIFGNYSHGLLAKEFLRVMPTSLNLEIYAKHMDGTNNETASGFGFVEGKATVIVANSALAVIYSDGTNFRLRSGAATSGAGAVDDTDWHLWKIKITSSGVEWFIDGSSQNSGSLLALETGEFPVNFGIGVVNAGSNFLKMAWVHIWYE